MGSDLQWEETAAPWFPYLATKKLPAETSSLGDIARLLKITLLSHASDPRDKLFGVISLVENKEPRQIFRPEYSLSYQSFWIGLVAHWLLAEKLFGLLRWARALGSESDDSFPCALTWVPELGDTVSWTKFLNTLIPREETIGWTETQALHETNRAMRKFITMYH